jgi:hypothetical protein
MRMSRVLFLCALAATFAAVHPAVAEPWLCTDADGVKAFSYEPESARNPRCVDHPVPSANVWRKRASDHYVGTPAAFPKVDARTQKQRDLARRQILERELAEEQKSLATAMRELAEYQQSRPVRQASPPPTQIKAYEDRIRVHQANIANLQKELGREG